MRVGYQARNRRVIFWAAHYPHELAVASSPIGVSLSGRIAMVLRQSVVERGNTGVLHLYVSTHSRFELRNIFVMRAIWKGSISFGLVNIPIALYPATRREELKFRLLRVKDLSLVNYKRVAETDGKEVPWDQIVKGYEYEKGKYIVLKDEDFQRVDVEAARTVDIQDFVDQEEIDPMLDRKSTRLNSSHRCISYAVFCLIKKKTED